MISGAEIQVRQSSRIASRVIEGKAVVIVIDRQRLHTLNEVGTRIWELCDGRTLSDIARTLAEEFDIDPETALQDATQFASELLELGALEPVEP